MGIEYESVVDHPLAEVFAWHTRPGAMTRLVPPWQPMTVVAETESLADGRAVLGLPGGLRWVAQHDRDGFDPPHRFVDVLSSAGPRSLPPRVIGWWRHTHEFAEAPGGGTTVRDEVDTTVPGAALRPTFVYRHRQLADDLAAHRDAAVGGREADGRRGHGRVRPGRVGTDGVSDDRRAPGDSAGPAAGAVQGRAAVAARRSRARPAVGRRRRGASGRRFDRRTLHRGAQGGDSRQPHRADTPAGAGGGRQRRRSAGVRQRVGDRHLRVRPRRRAAVRGKRARRRVPGRRGGRLGGRYPPCRRCRPARGHRAHRNRAGRGGRNAETAAAAVPGGPRREAGQRQAVAVVDRPRRPARRLPPRAVRHPAGRSRQRGRACAGAQHRIHEGAGGRASPARRCCRCRRSGRGCC